MRRNEVFVCAVWLLFNMCLFCNPELSVAEVFEKTVIVEGGTHLEVESIQYCSWAGFLVGQTIHLETTQETRVGEEVVINEGTLIQAEILKLSSAAGVDKSGGAVIGVDYVRAVDRGLVSLRVGPTNEAKNSLAAPIRFYLSIFPLLRKLHA